MKPTFKMRHLGAILPAIAVAALWAGCGSASSPLQPDRTTESESEATLIDREVTPLRAKQDFPFRRILCFGDSLTYGTTLRVANAFSALSPVEGYVPKLERLLTSEYGQKIDFINTGVGAESTAEGVERLDGELLIYRPDLVLLLEGAVDVGSEHPSYPKIRRNFQNMMQLVLRRDAAVIIGTVPPFDPEGFRVVGVGDVTRLNVIIRQEARELRVPIADHEKAFGRKPGLVGPDGVHPNDNGYAVMADTWFQAINELVTALSK